MSYNRIYDAYQDVDAPSREMPMTRLEKAYGKVEMQPEIDSASPSGICWTSGEPRKARGSVSLPKVDEASMDALRSWYK